ncbi:Anaerobic nitric oxide reductase flavorubredoxin [Labilithrix luteola]|uniref:Anaerobic nitric oxide reductase flavorubredoxin n=1 Tax=Labilithrix luteola TaxID=1391654 RepID=A0A0K1PU64_9BACT|nr:Anaerobic nitric oxide reductase flavorubredoxin [Labilithrix luteola]
MKARARTPRARNPLESAMWFDDAPRLPIAQSLPLARMGGLSRRLSATCPRRRTSVTTLGMKTLTHEIADRIYRISTCMPDVAPGGFTFNQFLIDADEPLLFHTGHRARVALVQDSRSRRAETFIAFVFSCPVAPFPFPALLQGFARQALFGNRDVLAVGKDVTRASRRSPRSDSRGGTSRLPRA